MIVPEIDPTRIVVVLPEGGTAHWAQVRPLLATRVRTTYIPQATFPVRGTRLSVLLHRRSPGELLNVVRGRDGTLLSAGGRISRLDLATLAHQADARAHHRWSAWNTLVARTTPRARDWSSFVTAHRRTPRALDLSEARQQFEAQPRVLTMMALNSAGSLPFYLDPEELDVLQAGEATYRTLHWQQALVGHALAGPPGLALRPMSDSIADRLRYLQVALGIVQGLAPDRCLIAATVAPHA